MTTIVEDDRRAAFAKCWHRANEIVKGYRRLAPPGCDPQATWVAVAVGVGSVAAAGISAYSSSSAGGAAEDAAGQAAASYKKTAGEANELLGGASEDALALLEPFKGKFDLNGLLRSVLKTNRDLLPEAQQFAIDTNARNQNELNKRLNSALPGVRQMVQQASNNTLSMLRGEIPQDREAALRRRAGQQALQGGFGNSESSRALEARDLGLDSLALMQEGGNSAQRWIQTARTQLMAPLFDPTSMLGTPQMELSSILAGLDLAKAQAGIVTGTAQAQVGVLTGQQNAATGAVLGGAEAKIKADQAAAQAIANGVQGATGAFASYKYAQASTAGKPAGGAWGTSGAATFGTSARTSALGGGRV